MRRRAVTFIASLLFLAACGDDEQAAAMESDFKTPYEAPPAQQVAAGLHFTQMRDEAGIDFVHVNGAAGGKLLPETMGSGVGMLDYDGDGDLDLLFVQSQEWEPKEPAPTMRLYRNEGGWRFTDATKEAGLDLACYGMGLTIADYDADGDPDVYITALGPDV
jgi:hypothetical protein